MEVLGSYSQWVDDVFKTSLDESAEVQRPS